MRARMFRNRGLTVLGVTGGAFAVALIGIWICQFGGYLSGAIASGVGMIFGLWPLLLLMCVVLFAVGRPGAGIITTAILAFIGLFSLFGAAVCAAIEWCLAWAFHPIGCWAVIVAGLVIGWKLACEWYPAPGTPDKDGIIDAEFQATQR